MPAKRLGYVPLKVEPRRVYHMKFAILDCQDVSEMNSWIFISTSVRNENGGPQMRRAKNAVLREFPGVAAWYQHFLALFEANKRDYTVVAAKLGHSASYINQLLHHGQDYVPGVGFLIRLADAREISLDELTGRKPPPSERVTEPGYPLEPLRSAVDDVVSTLAKANSMLQAIKQGKRRRFVGAVRINEIEKDVAK
jgi:hypothetical protein